MAPTRVVIKTDKYDLQGEWEQLASTYHGYAQDHADATLDRDKAKGQLDLVEAKLYSERRLKNVQEGSKMSEAQIQAMVISKPEYLRAGENLREAQHKLDTLTGTLRAMEFKKRALEYLSQMALRDWDSEPKHRPVPRAIHDRAAEGERAALQESMDSERPRARPRRIEA